MAVERSTEGPPDPPAPMASPPGGTYVVIFFKDKMVIFSSEVKAAVRYF